MALEVKILNREVVDTTTTDNPVFEMFGSYVGGINSSFWLTRRWYGMASERSKTHLYSRVVINGDEVDFGEDPRGILIDGRLHVTANIFSYEHGYRNKLIIENEGGSFTSYNIVIPKSVPEGKNWVICDLGGPKIHLIHSYSPLIILKEIYREKSAIIFDSFQYEGIQCDDFTDNYPIYRGGSPGLRTGYGIFGGGHTTVKSYLGDELINTHRPFFWRINSGWKIEILKCRYDFTDGHRVIDVTGLSPQGENLFSMYSFEYTGDLFVADTPINLVKYNIKLS